MSRSTRRVALVLAVAAAPALLAAGCGGEERLSKTAYEQQVRAVYAAVQSRFEATRAVSGSVLAARVAAAQAGLRDAADELEANEPPRAVEEEHEELVEGMRAYAGDLERLLGAVARGDAAAAERFNAELGENQAIEQMAEAAEEMTSKGFDLGRIAAE